MNDSELAVLEQTLEARHARLNAIKIVEPTEFFRLQSELGPRAKVSIVRIGDDGVQAIIGAGEFDHDKDARPDVRRRRGGGFVDGPSAKASDAASEAYEPSAQHVAATEFA
jgi:hypothetical protein